MSASNLRGISFLLLLVRALYVFVAKRQCREEDTGDGTKKADVIEETLRIASHQRLNRFVLSQVCFQSIVLSKCWNYHLQYFTIF